MGNLCSSLCGTTSRPLYSTSARTSGGARYGDQELMNEVEFENLLRMDTRAASDDADLLMGVADADLGRSPQKSDWERNPRVLSAEEIHNITRQKIEEIVRQQAIKDRELEEQFTAEELRIKQEEEAAIEARRLAAKALKETGFPQSSSTGAAAAPPAPLLPSTPAKSPQSTSATSADPGVVSPEMRRWLSDESNTAVPQKFTAASSLSQSESGQASALFSAAASRSPPADLRSDKSDDFDDFLNAVKAKTFSASAAPGPESAPPSTAVSASAQQQAPALSSPSRPDEPVVSAGTPDTVPDPTAPPPLSVTEDDDSSNPWNAGLSPELLQAMQATRNVETAYES